MIIGLMGMEFESENKGCEALAFSFLNILREISNKNITIYYFSNLGFGKVVESFPEFVFKKINLKIRDLKLDFIRAVKKCDYIFDVTMGDSFSDIYSEEVCLSDIRFKRLASFFTKKYILLPQTYGPFFSDKVKTRAMKVFSKTDVIFCRDELSRKYIYEEFGIKNSILSTDMAFALPYKKDMYNFTEQKKIGINISGLLFRGGFTQNNQFDLKIDYPHFVKKLIVILNETYPDYEIHLIPHVINLEENAHDDDYKVCKQLNKEYPDTILAPIFTTPIEAKSYISNMDIFIGSRMHSTVAAFSSGVLTIPVSYSRKFEGLFGSLNYPYVINTKKENMESAIELILRYIENKNQLVESHEKSMSLIIKEIKLFKESLIEILGEV